MPISIPIAGVCKRPALSWATRYGLLGAALLVVCGCGSTHKFEFDDLDISPTRESLSEFSFGKYEVPVPLVKDRANGRALSGKRLRFDFQLYALVAPDQASNLADDWERHEGKIRDVVIGVTRNASLDELQEPELGTLEARLMDAMQDQLGEREIRRLLMTEIVSQEL